MGVPEGEAVGDVEGKGVGAPAVYVGDAVGTNVGADVGNIDGTGVGAPGVYVGTAVGL